MPSSLQCAKELLDNVLTLLGDNENLTEEQRTSIVTECRRYVGYDDHNQVY